MPTPCLPFCENGDVPRTPRRVRRARPRVAPPPPPPEPVRVLHVNARTVLIDRLEEAVERNVIDLMADDGPADCVAVTTGELALLLLVLFPEEYDAPAGAAAATRTAPGSMSRVEEYARRVREGLALFARGDSRADGAGRGLKIEQRKNGTGPKVVGWCDDDGE
jgi:hypothetical protein